MNTVKTFAESIKKSKEQVVNEAITVGGPVTKPNTLPGEVEKILNDRLGDEYTAYYFYRNAANWCKNANYKKAAAFFEAEATGELGHALGIQDYLTSWNLLPAIPAVDTQVPFTSLVDIINKAYDLEYALLQKYSDDQMTLDKTHAATFNFIQGYVNIQVGEVTEYSDYLNALELVDVNNRLDVLYFENQYFG
jgi:ferritin